MRISNIDYKEFTPPDWKSIKLRQGFSFGKGLSITKDDLVEEGIPVISYGQIHSRENTGTGISESLIRFVPDSYLASSPNCIMRKNDIVFADTSEDYAGVGNCAFVDTDNPIFAGYHSIIARPIMEECFPKYYAYLFQTNYWRSQIRSRVMGIKVFSITQTLLRDTVILVPPAWEQQLIADYLDSLCGEINIMISTLENQIDTLLAYRKALINESVMKGITTSCGYKPSGTKCIEDIPIEWETSKIKYIIDTNHPYPVGDGDHGMIKADDYLSEGIPYIRVLNLTWGFGLNMENAVYISEDQNQKIKNSILRPNDILIAKTGATIGKTAIVPEWLPISNTTSHVGKITLPTTQCPKYFYYQLTSDVIQRQISDLSAMQSTRPELGIEGLKNLYVIVPPFDVQKEIAEYLDARCAEIDDVIKAKQMQLISLKGHKESIIFEYVTGKKRVKEVQ